ncbi:hypothetical protein DPMN_138583 [Dreissena polymorpha]|uniref:Uncharacterized protein n=1 Tax=Dreissena polymorpha TaxID=45954 RepID=A0A9D4G6Y0_DREPO|nr:hypothetical protein DPMN_138583 [Dreissena polymorpha]
MPTYLISPQTQKWPPPLHMPPPGYPVSGSIPVYPHTKVQTQSVTSAARTVRTDNGPMRPLEAFIRLAFTQASCRLITVVILHQVVSCRQAVTDMSCR